MIRFLDSVLRQKVSGFWRNLIFCVPTIKASLNQSFLLISYYWRPYRLLDGLVLDWLIVQILPILVSFVALHFKNILVLGLIEWYIFVRALFFSVRESFLSHHALNIVISILVSVSSHLWNTWLFFRCSEVDASSLHNIWRLRLVFVTCLHDRCLLLPAFAVIDASTRERWFRFVTAARRVRLLEMRFGFVSITSYILARRHFFPDWIVNAIDLHCGLPHFSLVTHWLVFRVFCRADLLGHGSDWGCTSRGQRFIVAIVVCSGILYLRLIHMLLHQRALNRLVVI